jgi:integrase
MNKVNIFPVKKFENSIEKNHKTIVRWRVKWRVNGHDKTRSFINRSEADELHRRLTTAKRNVEDFDLLTGLPTSWTNTQRTFAECAAEFVSAKWISWSAAHRRSTVEDLAHALIFLVKPGAVSPFSREVLSKAARLHILLPNANVSTDVEVADATSWLKKNSLPLDQVNFKVANQMMVAITKLLNGKGSVSPDTHHRRKTACSSVFEYAIKCNYSKANHLVKYQVPGQNAKIDKRSILTKEECKAIIENLDGTNHRDLRMALFLSILWMAGLRPSEALALRKGDLVKDGHGGHELILSRASVPCGTVYSNSGASKDEKGLKWRAAGETRVVPVPKDLAKRLRTYTKGMKSSDLIFESNTQGVSLSLTVFEDHWVKIRPSITKLYDLRHTNASILIYAGLNVAEVAARLGHSISVCSSKYIHFFNQYNNASNRKVEAFLAN